MKLLHNQKCLRLLLAFVVTALSARAQAPYYYTLSEENGLPSNEVYQVIQDDFGFMWIGCDAGLFRYDGVKIKRYPNPVQNGRSISELKFDAAGRLWCQNFAGQVFYVNHDSLILFRDFSSEFRTFPQFTIDREGNIWVAGENTIKVIDHNGIETQVIAGNREGKLVYWFDVEMDNEGNIYASMLNGDLALFKKQANGKYGYEVISTGLSVARQPYLERRKEGLFMQGETALARNYFCIAINGREIKYILNRKSFNFFIYRIAKDHQGESWLSTSNGVFSFHPATGFVDTTVSLIRNDKISSLFTDREGNMWLTSLQNGIHVIPQNKMILYNKQNCELQDNLVTSLQEISGGNLLVGTYNGLLYRVTQGNLKSLPRRNDNENKAVKKILPYKGGLFISSGKFSFLTNSREISLPMGNVRDFALLDDTLFCISSSSAVKIKANVAEGLVGKMETVFQKGGRAVAVDSAHKKVYFGTNDGLVSYTSGRLDTLLFNRKRINVSKLLFSEGKLWIGTFNDGMLYYDGKAVQQLQLPSRLKGSPIKTFALNNDNMFIATENCLAKLYRNVDAAQFYDMSDGLVSCEISAIVPVKDKVYLATNKGLMAFPEKMTPHNHVAPSVMISEVMVNNNATRYQGQTVELDYGTDKMKISYISACIKARGNFFYKYRLLGSDTVWSVVGSGIREVVYPSLPPGDYVFEVKAINEDGVESPVAGSVQIRVNKPFWQQWWFYVLVGLSGALLVMLISWQVIRSNNNKARIRNELISSQLTAIRAQMNPHFMYNTLNSIQDLVLKSDVKSTNYYLSKFSSLMRKILELSSLEKTTVSEEVEMLGNYLELEKLRFGNDFIYQINIAGAGVEARYIPTLIIQPFVENAVKHGLLHKKGKKELILDFVAEDKATIVKIKDNGIGRKRSEEIRQQGSMAHRSFATGAVQKRLELLNKGADFTITYQVADLSDEDGKPSGTEIILRFGEKAL